MSHDFTMAVIRVPVVPQKNVPRSSPQPRLAKRAVVRSALPQRREGASARANPPREKPSSRRGDMSRHSAPVKSDAVSALNPIRLGRLIVVGQLSTVCYIFPEHHSNETDPTDNHRSRSVGRVWGTAATDGFRPHRSHTRPTWDRKRQTGTAGNPSHVSRNTTPSAGCRSASTATLSAKRGNPS